MNNRIEMLLRAIDAFVVDSGIHQVPAEATLEELQAVKEHVEELMADLESPTTA